MIKNQQFERMSKTAIHQETSPGLADALQSELFQSNNLQDTCGIRYVDNSSHLNLKNLTWWENFSILGNATMHHRISRTNSGIIFLQTQLTYENLLNTTNQQYERSCMWGDRTWHFLMASGTFSSSGNKCSTLIFSM